MDYYVIFPPRTFPNMIFPFQRKKGPLSLQNLRNHRIIVYNFLQEAFVINVKAFIISKYYEAR